MSAMVFAGAAQFVALDLWRASTDTLPIGAILVSTLIVNLRFVLMSASLHPLFERERHRWLKAFLISDENWALTSGELAQGRGSVGFLLGAGALSTSPGWPRRSPAASPAARSATPPAGGWTSPSPRRSWRC